MLAQIASHILGYTDKEMLNTNISNYIKYGFDDIASTRILIQRL